MARCCLPLLLAALFMTHTIPAPAQTTAAARSTSEAIRYTVSFPAPHTHYAEVSADVPTGGRAQVELMMAVWTPGSYLVREYERNIESVVASVNGRSLPVQKSDKNRWRIATGGAARVAVRYRVYAREMSVRTNWVESGFALLNGAPTFLTLAERGARPHEVIIQPAAGWQRSITGLAEVAGAPHRYRAPDYDTLVDSPILIGNPTVHEFIVDGKRHYLANEGEAGVFDGAQAARDVEALVKEHRSLWRSLPYDKYVILNVLTAVTGQVSRGGLEHKNSMSLIASPWSTRTRAGYLDWLELVSHEFFHVWNVKRLRPLELGPFDYENEAHTRNLWIVEGVTEYYGLLTVHRAGFSSTEEFLGGLSSLIEELQTAPGRLVQSAEQASFDAWIKYYRPDENSANASISYYTKGAVLAFLLDARIRKATDNGRSLDDVMRAAFQKYSGEKGYSSDEFRGVAEQTAGINLATFWADAVQGTAELDYAEALDAFGLRFRDAAGRPEKAWLGATTRNDGGRLLVTEVRRDTPAYAAGLNVDDEILAFGEFRVRADRLDNRLDQYRPGDNVSLLVARREQLQRLDLTFGAEPGRRWQLDVAPMATPAQSERRARWLRSQTSA